MEILISVKHKYAKSIYKGTKKYELRKVTPNIKVGTICYIYEPFPTGLVTGQFIYDGVIIQNKWVFWVFNQDKLGVTKEEYFKYYKENEYVHAWKIKKPIRFGTPYTLKELGQNQPHSNTIITK